MIFFRLCIGVPCVCGRVHRVFMLHFFIEHCCRVNGIINFISLHFYELLRNVIEMLVIDNGNLS